MQGLYVYMLKEPSCWLVIDRFAKRSPPAEWHGRRGRHGRARASQSPARAKRASGPLSTTSDRSRSCLLLLPLAHLDPGLAGSPLPHPVPAGRPRFIQPARRGAWLCVPNGFAAAPPSTLSSDPAEPPPSPLHLDTRRPSALDTQPEIRTHPPPPPARGPLTCLRSQGSPRRLTRKSTGAWKRGPRELGRSVRQLE
jgi:hypothetical protein